MSDYFSSGHRGDETELYINYINERYDKTGIALITKVNIPIKVLNIDKGVITKAFYENKSTVDYTGLYRGVNIAFDAKETKQKSFPLKNLHEHQFEYMKNVRRHGGFSFLICRFKNMDDKWFLVPLEIVEIYWNNQKEGRKSIPFKSMNAEYEIKLKGGLPDYIPVVEKYIIKQLENEKKQ